MKSERFVAVGSLGGWAADPVLGVPVLERTSAAVLEKNVAVRPDKTAIVEVDGRSLTYRELQRSAYSIACGLRALGVGRQEHVLVMLGNHIDSALLWLGTTVGAVVDVPVNTAFKGDSLRYVCELSGAGVLVIEGEWCDRLDALVDGVPNLRTVVVRGGGGCRVPSRFRRVAFEDLLAAPSIRPEPPAVWDVNVMLSTSGTTGRSKAVLCSHGHAFATAVHPGLTAGADEMLLVTLPLFHATALLGGVYNAWRAGGTAVLAPRFSASQFWDQVRRYGCTATFLLGAQADFLWRQLPSAGDRDHPLQVAWVVPALANAGEFSARFGIDLITGYGFTEAGTVVASTRDSPRLSCGRPRAFAEVRIVDEHDMEVERGKAGEVVIRSSEPWSVMSGYHGMPEETARAWRNLWLHSGDMAYQDDEGNLFFIDRAKDAMRRRGENVSSFELEQYILAREDVAEAAVVAVPSEHTEDEIKAVLVLESGAAFDPVAIIRDLYSRMPYFMVPRYLEVVGELPKTLTHKVRKADLRQAGVTADTWDCHAAGLRITRDRLLEEQPARDATQTSA